MTLPSCKWQLELLFRVFSPSCLVFLIRRSIFQYFHITVTVILRRFDRFCLILFVQITTTKHRVRKKLQLILLLTLSFHWICLCQKLLGSAVQNYKARRKRFLCVNKEQTWRSTHTIWTGILCVDFTISTIEWSFSTSGQSAQKLEKRIAMGVTLICIFVHSFTNSSKSGKLWACPGKESEFSTIKFVRTLVLFVFLRPFVFGIWHRAVSSWTWQPWALYGRKWKLFG